MDKKRRKKSLGFKSKRGKITGPLLPDQGYCVFCRTNSDDDSYGECITRGDLTGHYFCMLFASGLSQKGKTDSVGLKGFLPTDILNEVRRVRRQMCAYCGKPGAAVGCIVRNCRTFFHYGCGIENEVLNQYFGNFASWCATHRPLQVVEKHLPSPRKGSGAVCAICTDTVAARPTADTLTTPCCAQSWFHRACIQRQAKYSALHFFKCPLCNNKDLFQHEMLTNGIHIPDQDAAWEREPDAFQELLERPSSCSMPACEAAHGRTYKEDDTCWRFIYCDVCGSQAAHFRCSKLKFSSQYWACKECIDSFGQDVLSRTKKKKPYKAHKSADLDKSSSSYPGPSTPSAKRKRASVGAGRCAKRARVNEDQCTESMASSVAPRQRKQRRGSEAAVTTPTTRRGRSEVAVTAPTDDIPVWMRLLLQDDIHTGANLGSKHVGKCHLLPASCLEAQCHLVRQPILRLERLEHCTNTEAVEALKTMGSGCSYLKALLRQAPQLKSVLDENTTSQLNFLVGTPRKKRRYRSHSAKMRSISKKTRSAEPATTSHTYISSPGHCIRVELGKTEEIKRNTYMTDSDIASDGATKTKASKKELNHYDYTKSSNSELHHFWGAYEDDTKRCSTQNITELPSKNTAMSTVWHFFAKEPGAHFPTCSICDVKLGYNTVNMMSLHLRRLHNIDFHTLQGDGASVKFNSRGTDSSGSLVVANVCQKKKGAHRVQHVDYLPRRANELHVDTYSEHGVAAKETDAIHDNMPEEMPSGSISSQGTVESGVYQGLYRTPLDAGITLQYTETTNKTKASTLLTARSPLQALQSLPHYQSSCTAAADRDTNQCHFSKTSPQKRKAKRHNRSLPSTAGPNQHTLKSFFTQPVAVSALTSVLNDECHTSRANYMLANHESLSWQGVQSPHSSNDLDYSEVSYTQLLDVINLSGQQPRDHREMVNRRKTIDFIHQVASPTLRSIERRKSAPENSKLDNAAVKQQSIINYCNAGEHM